MQTEKQKAKLSLFADFDFLHRKYQRICKFPDLKKKFSKVTEGRVNKKQKLCHCFSIY